MKPKPYAKWIVGLGSSVFLGLAIGQLSVASNEQPSTVNTGDSYSNETTIPGQPSRNHEDEWGESDNDDGSYYEDDGEDGWNNDQSSGFNQPGGGSDGQSSHSK